jgi:hypothetical protein
MRKRRGNCLFVWCAIFPPRGVSSLCRSSCPAGLSRGIVKRWRADVSPAHDSKEQTRSQTIEDSYGSIWASPYSAHDPTRPPSLGGVHGRMLVS